MLGDQIPDAPTGQHLGTLGEQSVPEWGTFTDTDVQWASVTGQQFAKIWDAIGDQAREAIGAHLTGPVRGTYMVGLCLRRQFRALLDQFGVKWVEHKGLLESTFVVTGQISEHEKIRYIIRINTDKETPEC